MGEGASACEGQRVRDTRKVRERGSEFGKKKQAKGRKEEMESDKKKRSRR